VPYLDLEPDSLLLAGGRLVGYLAGYVSGSMVPSETERMGFVAHGPQLLVPGITYNGKRLHQQTMVWNPFQPATGLGPSRQVGSS